TVSGAAQQIEREARLETRAEVTQYGGPLFIEQRSHFGSLPVGRIVRELGLQRVVIVAGEQEEGGTEVLVQVGSFGVVGERLALGAVGRPEEDFGVSAIDVGSEDGGDAPSGDGFAEDQVAVGEVDFEIFLDDGKIANTVT